MAQQLWLLRHGEAVPHDSKPDDERELTARGERQSAAAGAALARLGVEFAAIYTSPKVRAQQIPPGSPPRRSTPSPRSRTCSPTASTATTRSSCSTATTPTRACWSSATTPSFTQVVYDLTGGRIDFKKGAVAAIRIEGREGELIALLRPRELESLAVTG